MGDLGKGTNGISDVISSAETCERTEEGDPKASETRWGRPQKAGFLRIGAPEGIAGAFGPSLAAPAEQNTPTLFAGVDFSAPIVDLSRTVDGGREAEEALLQLARGSRSAMPPWKRALDLAFGAFSIVLLSPLFLLVAVYIKIVSPGPLLFRQDRIGLRGRPFSCLKFRSMHYRADTSGHERHLEELRRSDRPMAKLDAQQDARVIRLGQLMRALALDELPQLINVLRGDMSLVGPRPAIPYEYENYEPWQRLRFCAVPGMTGLWQVTGKNHTTFSEMIRLDTRYALTKRLGMDVKILILTPGVLVGQVVELARKKKGERREKPD